MICIVGCFFKFFHYVCTYQTTNRPKLTGCLHSCIIKNITRDRLKGGRDTERKNKEDRTDLIKLNSSKTLEETAA